MGAVIAYDRPVRDFIDGLSATGHVTHTKHRKTSVTLHHNGGRLSLQGILDVWKVRPASAHFQVDGGANVGQYVNVAEYAWATGTTPGNQQSISIEMANSTLGPEWRVAEVTWREAARLAGWLHARVIGVRPTRSTLKLHKDWKATICAGPYIDAMYGQILAAAQSAYDQFVGGGGGAPAPTVPQGGGGVKPLDQVVEEVIGGQWGNGLDRQTRLTRAGYDAAAVQAAVNARLGGARPPVADDKSVDQLANEVIAGHWGNGTDRQHRLSAAGYDSAAVQAAVNQKLGQGGGAPAQATRPSLYAVAKQVIAGQWGNGNDRRQRLTAAGFNYNLVQAEVNRQLR